MARGAGKRRSGGARWLRHKGLIAVEAMLVLGLAKDLLTDRVKASALPSYGKVLFLMAATIGVFGGLYFVLERLSTRGVEKAHEVARALPLPLPYWIVHAALLAALYYFYARTHGLQAF
jgi:hypothetical protein